MKKMILVLSAVCSFVATSCFTTQKVVSSLTYENSRNEVAFNMEANGYTLSGENHEKKNEVLVTGQSYSKSTGYGTLMDNNYQQFDTYQFGDEDGQTAEYTVKYQLVMSDSMGYALANVEVLGCKTSKAADYSKVCTGKHSPASVIGNMQKDATKTKLDVAATTLAVSGIAMVFGILIVLIAL